MEIHVARTATVRWVVALVLAAALAVPGVALAAGTPAGTIITNQATVTFTDTSNNPYTQLSNTTSVTVTPVYGVLLNDPGNRTGFPLDNVTYAYTIQNIGNATDNYALSASSVPGWTTTMYVDTNRNGTREPTETTVVSSPVQLVAGDNAYIFVVVTIPAATPNGTTAVTTLTVTGSLGGAEDDATDASTTTVQAPVLGVLKNVRNVTTSGTFDNTANAAPTQELEYRIAVTNSGASAASALVLSDPLNTNTGYKLASATCNAGSAGPGLACPGAAAFSTTAAPGPYVYGYTPVNQGCSAPLGYDYCVTSVRWTMTGSQAPGTNFNVNFIVRVK
jgi:uncharacterized repeat protein (TIGR01451 family)